MKKAINILMLFGLCAISGSAEAAAMTLNLRSASRPSAIRLLSAPAPTGSCLQSATLPAGAAATGPLAVGDVITFLLFEDTEIRVTLSERMESPLGGEAFIGTVCGYDGVKNAVVLQTAEGLTVDIQDFAHSRTYTIVSGSDGVIVKEIDPSLETVSPAAPVDPGLPTMQSVPRLLTAPMTSQTPDQPDTTVDILVAYDTPAAAWVRQYGGGITNFATIAVQKMNTVLGNCGLATSFRFRLVGVMTVNVSGCTDMDDVLEKTRSGKGVWAPVKAMRDTVGADIVTTLIDIGSTSDHTGIGYSLEREPLSSFSESAYNVCSVRAVANSHTMTHEVAHNIGAGHATAVHHDLEPGPQLYNYSSGYYFTGTNDVAYHTIMAYNSDGYGNNYVSAPFFSSPDITYMGTAVGNSTHDNVLTIRQTYLAASRWREQTVPMSYDVFFSPEDDPTFSDSLYVTLTPGKAGLPIRYTIDGSMPTVSSMLYTGPIKLTHTTTIRAATVTDDGIGPVFQATYSVRDLGAGVDAPQLEWRTSDTHPWTFQTTDTYDGIDALRSTDDGAFYGNESWIETTVTGPTHMSFRYKTRKKGATFSVLVDNAAVLIDTDDTTADTWTLHEISIPDGPHTVRFRFQCWMETSDGRWEGLRYSGFNGAWLDTIQFDALSGQPTISPATTTQESSATTFQGSITVTLTPPSGKSGFLCYTLDGSDPTRETQLLYEGPIVLTRSAHVRAVFVEVGKEPSAEVGGIYLERHPVSPGEWTTDVHGAKTAAAQNGSLIAVLLADRVGSHWSKDFYSVAESPAFLAWAKANGIYLVTGDKSCNIGAEAANDWFWQLRSDYGESGSADMPTILFANPNAPTTPIGKGLARNNGSKIGNEPYRDTVESLIAGFASVIGTAKLRAPSCSRTNSLVDDFPITVTLSNPNSNGTIYYTLDGSTPTPSNGKAYSGAIAVPDSATTLTAMVWPTAGLSSGMYVGNFKAIKDVFSTSGIVWSQSGTGSWREDEEPGTLCTGGLMSNTYVATLQATVMGNGKLVFTYAFNSLTPKNTFAFKVNGRQQFSNAYNGSSTSFAGTVTNAVSSATATTYTWTYTVADASRDYGPGYALQAGAWLSNVQWIPADPDSVAKVPYIRCIADPADGGKVTGGGSCASGKAVTLKAAASKNFSFVGWSKAPWSGEQGTGNSLVATTATLVIDRSTMPAANSNTSTTITDVEDDVTYYAVFKSYPEVFVIVDSTNGGAEPTGSGAGKYVAGTVTGMGKYAPGKAKIALKATANKDYVFSGWYANAYDNEPLTRNATYTIASIGETDVRYTARFITAKEDKDNIGLEVNGAKMSGGPTSKPAWTNFCGVAVNWPVISSGLSETTVKVAGLPSGLKLVQDKVTKAYTVAGAPSAASKVDKNGATTPSTVVFTVTTAGKSTQTFAVDLYVEALPAWAIGSFEGAVRSGDMAAASLIGSASMAVAASGKITGKAMIGGTNWTFKADAISSVELPISDATATFCAFTTNFAISAVATAGKATLPLAISIASFAFPDLPASATSRGVGKLGNDMVALYRVVWADKTDTAAARLIAGYAGSYSFTCADTGGTMAFTLDEKGVAKGAATLPYGSQTRSASFSANAVAELDGIHVVVVLPPDEKKGYVGVFEDRTLVAHSGPAAAATAFRDPGVSAVTAPFYPDSTASGNVAVTPKYGQVAAGKTVTLKATAAKGSVFAGWFDGTVLLSQATSLALPAPDGDKTITAMFITTDEDKRNIALSVNGAKLYGSTTETPRWSIFCGVAVNWPVISSGLSQTTVKAAGLPSGLKLVQDKTTKAYTIAGAPSAASKVDKDGVATPYKVIFTVTTTGKSTQTFALDLYVDALPAWATGSFDGIWGTGNGERGTVSLSIAANGKISGKLLRDDGTWKLAADSFASYASDAYLATVVGKNGNIVETYDMMVTAAQSSSTADTTALHGGNDAMYMVGMAKAHAARPTAETGDSSVHGIEWTAMQNLWKRTDTKAKMPTFPKSIDKTLDLGDAGDMNNSVKLTFKKDGVVAFAGKVNGASMSGSSQLVLTDDGWQVTLYAPSKALFQGFCKTIAVSVDADGTISKVEVKQ